MSAETVEETGSRKRRSRWAEETEIPVTLSLAHAATASGSSCSSSTGTGTGTGTGKPATVVPIEACKEERVQQAAAFLKTGWQGMGAGPALSAHAHVSLPGPGSSKSNGSGSTSGKSNGSGSSSSGRWRTEEEAERIWSDPSPPRHANYVPGGGRSSSHERHQHKKQKHQAEEAATAAADGKTGVKREAEAAAYTEPPSASAPAPAPPPPPKQLANFGLSGALSKDAAAGNVLNGVTLRWSEPKDAAAPPPAAMWRLYVFKGTGADPVEVLHIHRQSAYLIGRDERVCDIVLQHPSASKQHAVIQYRSVLAHPSDAEQWGDAAKQREVRPYLMDLESANRTLLNGLPVEPARYYELRPQDSVRFGGSSRDYVLMLA